MTDELAEAKRQIQNILTLARYGYLPPDEQAEVDAAQAFLDREGQTVEGGPFSKLTDEPFPELPEGFSAPIDGRPTVVLIREEQERLKAVQVEHDRTVRLAALEEAAKIADAYADENEEMMGDAILHNPMFTESQFDREKAKKLMADGVIHSSMFHAAQNVAAAIRSLIDQTGGEGGI